MEGMVDSIAKLCDEVGTVNGFCYFRDKLNASADCEAAITARIKNRLNKIQEMWRVAIWK